MIKYNIYGNNKRLNRQPLSQEEVDKIKQMKTINKFNKETNSIETISVEDINIIKCYIV